MQKLVRRSCLVNCEPEHKSKRGLEMLAIMKFVILHAIWAFGCRDFAARITIAREKVEMEWMV